MISTILRKMRDRAFDPASLQFRLTIEITALATIGLGSVALWTSWKMQQILITTHTQNIQYIATRFPRDVELYSEMLPVETGLQKTINNLTVPGLLIWVKSPDGKLLAQSNGFNAAASSAELISLTAMPLKPQVYAIGNRYLVLCERRVVVKETLLGTVYLARDVTQDQHQLATAIQGLTVVCVLVTGSTMGAIAQRIRRSLRPLQEMNRLAEVISAEDLGQATLQLTHAPSEVKALALTFNMMLSRLSESWEQQRQFVSNVSHELRTPLTLVSGYLQSVLRRSTNLNDYQREALETAASEADRTVRLLQDLLDLARAENGRLSLRSQSIVLNEVIQEIAGMAEKFSHRTITIEATTTVEVIGDRDHLRQILINLIDNAVKYSAPEQPILLRLEQLDKQALIQVCDRGVGIPLQDQSRIFDRFYRVDEARSRSTGGYGLGLAIVKTLVEGMGGSISVQSKPGDGSTFTIVLMTRSTR